MADEGHQRHVAGMLDRDQRTAKIWGGRERTEGRVRWGQEERGTKGAGRRGMQRLLLVGACLSIVSGAPRQALAAPTAMDQRWLQPARWVNPCGGEIAPPGGGGSGGGTPSGTNLDELIDRIAVSASTALKTAHRVKADYAIKAWTMDSESLSRVLGDIENYNWMPDLKKTLGEDVPLDEILSRNLDENLRFMYESLQKIAVGVEQMIWDQQDHGGPFHDQFNQTYNALISVLCEIQLALPSKVEPITREHMSAEDRRADKSERDRRDFVILREYENAVEYVLKALPHLKTLIA